MSGVGHYLEYGVRHEVDEPPGDRFSPERIGSPQRNNVGVMIENRPPDRRLCA
jgi:hypothetical protein